MTILGTIALVLFLVPTVAGVVIGVLYEPTTDIDL
jgi:hypothetical protein